MKISNLANKVAFKLVICYLAWYMKRKGIHISVINSTLGYIEDISP